VSHESNPFRLAGDDAGPGLVGAPVVEGDRSASALERVAGMIASSDVLLFMKGVPERPMCGFSANTVAILESLGVPYATFDVLSDESIRDAAKRHASWPTFPQLWVRGELVGGNDIVVEMLHAGELEPLLRGAAS
jgi:monothiol glutaredoxin